MWRKFLERNDFTFGSRMTIEGVKLSASLRDGMTPEERQREHAAVAARVTTLRERAHFRAHALASLRASWQLWHRDTLQAARAKETERLRAADDKAAELCNALAAKETELRQAAVKEAEMRQVVADLEAGLRHARRVNAEILASTSWKVSRPVRWIGSIFKKQL
jgi:hypothetical protein